MRKQLITIFFLGSSLYSYTMLEETVPLFSTFADAQLTPETLPILAPQLPESDQRLIRGWINVNLNKRTLKGLATLKWPLAGTSGNFAQEQAGINRLLQFQGTPNLSRFNYIFKIPSTKYVIQMAGTLNRVKNLLVHNDPNPENPTLQDKTPDVMCDRVIHKQPATYQTVSRMAHYLRAKEAIDKFNLNAIMLPETYLVGIDEDLPEHAHDDNSLIIQEEVTNVMPVQYIDNATAGILTEEAVRQLLILTVYAALFDLKANLLLDKKTGKFVITDLEQPNNSNPSDFFHKRLSKVLRNIRSGVSQINEMLSKFPHLRPICQKFALMSDDELVAIGLGYEPER